MLVITKIQNHLEKQFYIEFPPKTRKIRNATKTPSHQNTPKLDNKCFNFGEIWCFCDLVAKSDFSKGTKYSLLKKTL
jgi:hypothetical protein